MPNAFEDSPLEWPSHARTREEAQRFLATIAPFLGEETAADSAKDVEQRLKTIQSLRERLDPLQKALSELNQDGDEELRQTVERAGAQLPTFEEDLRRRLARVKPGHPEGIVDLADIQERLARREAQQELGEITDLEIPARLSEVVSPANWVAAGGIGVFGMGWTAFTTFHAIFMIGGMSQAIGWAALFLLAFYSIFFFVGFGMLYAAKEAASEESFELVGRELTIRKKFLGTVKTRRFELAADRQVRVGEAPFAWKQKSESRSANRAVLMKDVNGKTVSLGLNLDNEGKQQLAKRLRAYLAAQPSG